MITHVAIRFNGEIYSLPNPNRHCHVIRYIVESTGIQHVDVEEDDEGFLDHDSNFLNRKEALIDARLNGQLRIDVPIRYDLLFSENLW